MRKFFLAILTAAIFSIGISAYHHARVGARPPEHPRAYDRKPPAPATRDDCLSKPSQADNGADQPYAAPENSEDQPRPDPADSLKDNRIQTLLIALKASPALTPGVVLNTSGPDAPVV